MQKQSTRHILLTEPVNFYGNPQTMPTNEYQNENPEDISRIKQSARQEFRLLRDALVNHGIIVTSIKGQHGCPDDVFCNNWTSTHQDGRIVLYSMLAENRRPERRQDVIDLLEKTYDIALDLGRFQNEGKYLESTGSLVLDRVHKVAYGTISARTDKKLAEYWAGEMGYRLHLFNTRGKSGKPIYHTDVLMYIGTEYAGICSECIDADEREDIVRTLSSTHEIIDLSLDQISHFCGNALEVVGENEKRYLVMSDQAHNAYTSDQLNVIRKYTSGVIYSPLDTIEKYGGGSARCMMLELH